LKWVEIGILELTHEKGEVG